MIEKNTGMPINTNPRIIDRTDGSLNIIYKVLKRIFKIIHH